MTAAPWFKFYARDWLSSESVRLMGNARGDFVDLLCLQSIEGSVPSDPESIRQLVGRNRKEWPALWEKLEPKFPLCDDGRRRNIKQGQVVDEQENYWATRRESGSRGGSKRVANTKVDLKVTSRSPQGSAKVDLNQAEVEAEESKKHPPTPPPSQDLTPAPGPANGGAPHPTSPVGGLVAALGDRGKPHHPNADEQRAALARLVAQEAP